MKVAMIDPSLFTLPYDTALTAALRARGCDVTLHGRPLRPLEVVAEDDRVVPSFYAFSEKLRGRAPGVVVSASKGSEHALDWLHLAATFRGQVPSVVHFQWSPLPAIDTLVVRYIRLRVAPVVLTVHDAKPFNNSPTSFLQRIGSRNIWREFDHLIVHTEGSRDILAAQGVSPGRISVIPHGVLETVTVAPPPVREAKRISILLFGRIKTYKGIDVLIEALGRLPEAIRAGVEVVVVGEPMISVEPMQRRAEELGVADHIVWNLHYVSDADMGRVFRQADIFAFPYREIDTSGVLMSCLPYAKPIIASAIGAFPKLLQDGQHGRLVPPNDPAALAEAMASLLENSELLERCGRNVGLLTSQVPSWDTIAGQTIALYAELLRARTSGALGLSLRCKTV